VIDEFVADNDGRLDMADQTEPEDLGFRVFKLTEATSHYARWSGTAEQTPRSGQADGDVQRRPAPRLGADERHSRGATEGRILDKDDVFICRDSALDDQLAANLALQCRLKTI
jgi:hypothetical protein